MEPLDREALDAYSAVVTGVAAALTPRVAALRIRGGRGESAGSAVTLSDEGHLLTALPAFFVDVPVWIKLAVGLSVLATVAAIVLMFSGARRPVAVLD